VGDPTPLDAWGNPIVLVPIYDNTPGGPSQGQYYYVLISAGSTDSLRPSGTLGTAVAAYGALQGPYTSTQYPPTGTPYAGSAPIWAVTTPLQATVTSSNATSTGNLDNASYGPILTISPDNPGYSTTEQYTYWLPLK
jgi:hypothetical protein